MMGGVVALEDEVPGLPELVEMVTDGRLRPVISATTSWTEVASGLAALRDREVVGKIVLRSE